MDKLGESFKAIVAVFHGIISTWLFIDFSEKKVDEFHFVILLVFFTVTNVLIWNALLRVKRVVRPGAMTTTPLVDFQSGTYRLVDGIGLTLIAVAVGLFSAYLDRKDVVLWLGSTVANWDRTSSDPPFETTMLDITENRPANVDKRSRRFVDPARAEGAYLRVYVKDAKLGYEGYPRKDLDQGRDQGSRGCPYACLPLRAQRARWDEDRGDATDRGARRLSAIGRRGGHRNHRCVSEHLRQALPAAARARETIGRAALQYLGHDIPPEVRRLYRPTGRRQT